MGPPILHVSSYARDLLSPSSPSSPQSPWSPTLIADNFRRPSRLRGRVMILILGVLAVIFLGTSSRRTVNTGYDDAALSQFVGSGLSNPLLSNDDDHRQNHVELNAQNHTALMVQKPRFHLLVPGDRKGADVCKSMVSAAVLHYPPPTLMNWGSIEKATYPGAAGIKSVLRFLNSKNVKDEDIVLIINEDTWFQLPAEVLVHRFVEENRKANLRLFETFGLEEVPTTEADARRHPKFTQKVLFAAGKTCTPSHHGDPACSYLPESPLGSGGGTNTEYSHPRFLTSGDVIGRASHLKRLYQRARDLLEDSGSGTKSAQAVFSKIFAQQEIHRETQRQQSQTSTDKWKEWVAGKWSGASSRPQFGKLNLTATNPTDFEFGIGLDYDSSIFQIMENSIDDVRFVRFDRANRMNSPHRQHAKSFTTPIKLPEDLLRTRPPFEQNQDTEESYMPQKTGFDAAPDDLEWSDVNLATNIAVPGSQIPAAFNFHETGETARTWWHRMWYHEFTRALMRRYMRSTQGFEASEASKEGGEKWWDLRGGKGGVWTDRDEWLEWREVCGNYDADVFDDGHGAFGTEEAPQPVYNSFGSLLASDK